jgi:hypothetical protein
MWGKEPALPAFESISYRHPPRKSGIVIEIDDEWLGTTAATLLGSLDTYNINPQKYPEVYSGSFLLSNGTNKS